MSNEMINVSLLPCPFCGQQDFLIERLDSDASVVICQGLTGPHEACLARGPVGVAQDEGEEQPGRDKAVELWNARAAQHQGESVYQLRNNVLATNWRDADKAAYDSVGDNPSYERRVLYTRPAEQPVLAIDQWPKLEKPALVGAGRFNVGLSARLVVEAAQRHYEYEVTPENETLRIATGKNFLALLAQLEQLRGLRPAIPPRPPEGNGLPRYGLRWNGPQQPLATPMDDGYWTPWHLANELRKDAERYQWLRSRDLETISHGGVFAGLTPQNMVLNEETLDEAVDAAMAKEVQP
ncbi:Lar family restriction alleviation protein [Pseudomonas chlororaphis]|uniref:Lar family restriction alleviation protein n=1 Tax=Pseudomonas chlororaphis TaxID=587753 RepID=UPI00209B5DD6|nr:Lar family restriction alleviation protein [Pseudomonas chlororaphis]MCO7610951.1 Lar family restriction alleviation protein [Pseudomonas chlororaphis]